MKHEWKKQEKLLYLPTNKPSVVRVPCLKFFLLEGSGNPNDDFFSEYISVLYGLSYAVKMSPKKGKEPKGFFDYTVYPLEGVWDLNENGRKNYANGKFDKNDLVFKLMIRQPDFVDAEFAFSILEELGKKKPHPLLELVRFEEIEEGECIQMMHLGPYAKEAESFLMMEEFASINGLKRKKKTHREIYLSDARKVPEEKLKTVLRFEVEKSR